MKRTIRFEYWQNTQTKEWHWHVKSGREIIAQGEGYKRARSVLRVLKILAEGTFGAAVKITSPTT